MKSINRLIRLGGFVLVCAAIVEQLRRPADERTWTGSILIFPYDFRMPTFNRLMERWWNPNDERTFTPNFFGVGWSVNLYQVVRRLRDLSQAQ